MHEVDDSVTYEVYPDFLEHAHREDLDQPELPWASGPPAVLAKSVLDDAGTRRDTALVP